MVAMPMVGWPLHHKPLPLGAIAIALLALVCSGAEPQPDLPSRVASMLVEAAKRPRATAPHCGVFAVGRAIEVLGGSFDYGSAIQLKYIGTDQGSSATELRSLLSDCGYHSTYVSTLSKWEFENCGLPIIAHVRSSPDARLPDHWVCVVCDDKGANVFDGDNEPRLMRFTEFVPLWDGNCIIVANKASSLFVRLAELRIGLAVSICLFVIGCYFVSRKIGWLWPVTLTRQVAVMVLGSFVLALIGNACFADLLQFSANSRIAQRPFVKLPLPEVGLDGLLQAGRNDKAILIDATRPSSYQDAHIPGAINIPVDTPLEDIHFAMRDVARDTPIVVYCRSKQCDYDYFLARRLVWSGFTNVSVGNVGTAEYLESIPLYKSQ